MPGEHQFALGEIDVERGSCRKGYELKQRKFQYHPLQMNPRKASYILFGANELFFRTSLSAGISRGLSFIPAIPDGQYSCILY